MLRRVVLSVIFLCGHAFVFNLDRHLSALLQSTGLMSENKTFMREYYEDLGLMDPLEECPCSGCEVGKICLQCVGQKKCEKINGTFCA